MAIISCEVDDAYCDEDKDGYTTYTVQYKVIADAATGPEEVRQHGQLPDRFSTYSINNGGVIESNAFAVFQGLSVRFKSVEDSRRLFIATAKFSDKPDEGQKKDPDQPPGDPLDEPPEISTHSQKDKKPILLALDGEMIASSAGEPYDPVQEIDDTHYLLRIVKNFPDIDLAFNASYRDAINSDIFFGCAPETVKVETPGTFERLWAGNTKYYRVTWEFSLLSGEDISGAGPVAIIDDWRLKLYDYGMYKLVGTAPNQKRVTIKGLDGADLSAPTLLDNAGAVLAIGQSPKLRRTPLGYPVYRQLPFAALGLPTAP